MSSEKQSCHADWLRWLGYAKKMTHQQIAAALGVSPPAVSRWASGSRVPREVHWRGIARLAGVSVQRYWSGAPGLDVEASV